VRQAPKTVRSVAPADALRASLAYHFADATVDGVFARHASVQFDPLAPLGCNHDLVFAARVPGYRIGDYANHVYRRRVAYDGWDKQASLVEIAGQPARRRYHVWFGERWRQAVLERWPAEVEEVTAQLRDRGPLDALEVALDTRLSELEGSWYGPRLAKRILRALWHTGRVATSARRHGRHLYDLTERVLPAEVLAAPTPGPEQALATLMLDRHRATGLLRPSASAEVWSMPVPAAARRHAIARLVDDGSLTPFDVAGQRHHAVPGWLDALASGGGIDGVRFVAPLDPLVWDRPGLKRVFGFDYLWEVYKPAVQRRWGYYVLPVVHRDRFVARIDASREVRHDGEVVWRVERWWWEDGVAGAGELGRSFATDLERAAARFAGYLGASRAVIRGGVPNTVASIVREGALGAPGRPVRAPVRVEQRA